MKKIAALMLALVIAIAAIGCSAPADQNQDNTPALTTTRNPIA